MHLVASCALAYSLFVEGAPASAQLNKAGPPPFTRTVARQLIRTLREQAGQDNRDQTVDSLAGLFVWHRPVFDDELAAAWQRDGRAKLTVLIDALADARAAAGIVAYPCFYARAADGSLPRDLSAFSRGFEGTEIAGLHATPKGLRQGFGIKAAVCNVLLNMTQKWLGRAPLLTTAIYASAIRQEERQIAQGMRV